MSIPKIDIQSLQIDKEKTIAAMAELADYFSEVRSAILAAWTPALEQFKLTDEDIKKLKRLAEEIKNIEGDAPPVPPAKRGGGTSAGKTNKAS